MISFNQFLQKTSLNEVYNNYDDDKNQKAFIPYKDDDGRLILGKDYDAVNNLLRGLKPVNLNSLTAKDNGAKFYISVHNEKKILFTTLAVVTFDNIGKVDITPSGEWDYKKTKPGTTFSIKLSNGKYYNNMSSYNTVRDDIQAYDIKELEAHIEKQIKKLELHTAFSKMDDKLSSKLISEFKGKSIHREYENGEEIREVSCVVTTRNQFAVLTVTSTPKGTSFLKSGNILEIWYLPLEDGTVKRHSGAFSVRRTADFWFSDDVQIISASDAKEELSKVFELVKTTDATSYSLNFKK